MRPDDSRSVTLTAAVVVVGVALAVGVTVILSVAFAPAPPVTSNPPPASSLSVAQVFGPTKGLISDPFVLPTDRLDYMYSSGPEAATNVHLPERTFTVMGTFLSYKDAIPKLPPWLEPGIGLWSPDVRKVGRTYVMWFSGLYRGDTLPNGSPPQCIGYATSSSPTGPFTSEARRPVICQTAQYGDIDPRTMVTPDGQEWIYWKNDGNASTAARPTHIYAQRLATDGRTLLGSPRVLLTNDLPWEGTLIEAPDMIHVGDHYLLFFSGNAASSPGNGIGLAVCRGPDGPCRSPYAGPWLGSSVQGDGPGEETVYQQNGITWMLYTPHAIYYPFALPQLAAARIAFDPDALPYVADRQGMVPGVTAGRDGQTGQR